MRRPKMQLQDYQLDNFFRFLGSYPEDWQREIITRSTNEPFPPYEFWRGIQHRIENKMVGMVARGIARWIEQEHEYKQDFVLDLLDSINLSTSDAEMNDRFNVVCMSIWSDMKAYDWLKRHACDCDHKSSLWRQAVVKVICCLKENNWNELRNYKPQFFISVEANDG